MDFDMKKLKPWLLLLLVFLAGFAGGVVVTRVAVRHFVQQIALNPSRMRDVVERRLTRRLRLDEKQRQQVHEILLKAQDQIKSVRVEVQPQLTAILQDTRNEIADVLTPGQREAFEKFQEENRRFWQPR